MKHCFWCHEGMADHLTWGKLFTPKKERLLCFSCEGNLELVGEEICEFCSKPSRFRQCADCKYWEQLYMQEDPLKRNISIYTYNDFMKGLITKWKYRGDYQLGHIFKDTFLQIFTEKVEKEYNQLEIMPIPLGKKREYERAFNQAELLASFLGKELNTSLIRKQEGKQSKKSRKERLSSENPFNLTKSINKSVLLVDDIYTTGRTIRHAAELLKMHGCPNVYAYTLIRG